MARTLEGKLAIVTGGSRGIGAAIAENLASKGANVVLNYTSSSSSRLASDLATRLSTAHSITAHTVQADIGTPEGAAHVVESTKSFFSSLSSTQGDKKFQIDILINNAGVAINNLLPAVTVSEFEETYRVNVLGPLLITQAVAPHLPTDRSGRIVNLSSVSSSTGFVTQTVYGGSKAAIEAMTRTWSRELADRATVNAVNPGPVEGPMYKSNTPEFLAGIKGWIMHTPLMKAREGVDAPEVVADAEEAGGRPAYTPEVAGVVGMLCSEDAAWCTGQVVCANGGMLMLH